MPSVSGPNDQTWSPGARDGALGRRTGRPNLVYRCLGRCPRSADQSTKLGLLVIGTVPSVNGPLDQTWSPGSWDGASVCWSRKPDRQRNPLNPWCAGPGNLAEPSRAAKPPGLSASRNSWDISQNAGSWQFTLPKGPAQKTVPWDGALGRQRRRRSVVLPTKLKVA